MLSQECLARRFGSGRRIRLLLLLCVSLAVQGVGLWSRADATPFVSEVVASCGALPDLNNEHLISLALDPAGIPAIAYYSASTQDLLFTRRIDGVWTTPSVIDSPGDVGFGVVMRIDQLGRYHVAYQDRTNHALKYATRAATDAVWDVRSVPNFGTNEGNNIAMVVDYVGVPHIAHYRIGAPNIERYATPNGPVNWTTETVDGGAGGLSAIAVDADNVPYVAFRNSGDCGGSACQVVSISRRTGTGSWNFNLGAQPVYKAPVANQLDLTDIGLVIDRSSRFHVCFASSGQGVGSLNGLYYIAPDLSSWDPADLETVLGGGAYGRYCSMALDNSGRPCIAYLNEGYMDLMYSVRTGANAWTPAGGEFVGVGQFRNVGRHASLAMDVFGNPRIAYYNQEAGQVVYATAAVEIGDPGADVTYPVGSALPVTWAGVGPVDVYLSTDGGFSWSLQASALVGGYFRLIVPYAPSHFCRLKVVRSSPHSESWTEGFFTISPDINLLGLAAKLSPGDARGVLLSWSSEPGLEHLSGYRLERAQGEAGRFEVVAPLLRAVTYLDPAGGSGDRYRLVAINGLGQSVPLGEVRALGESRLSAWPSPFRAGSLQVRFTGQANGTRGEAGGFAVFDALGRRVRFLPASEGNGYGMSAVWDGKDEAESVAPNGVYFIRALGVGGADVVKVIVSR